MIRALVIGGQGNLLDHVWSAAAYGGRVEFRDDQPMQHEFRNKTYVLAAVEPLDVDGVRTVEVGTGVFFLAFLGLLPFYGRLQEDGHEWWLWMCLAGVGLGLFGLEYCRRRRHARQERDADHADLT